MNTEDEKAMISLLKRRKELKPVIDKIGSYSAGAGPFYTTPTKQRVYCDAVQENTLIEQMILDLCERMFPTDST